MGGGGRKGGKSMRRFHMEGGKREEGGRGGRMKAGREETLKYEGKV